MSVKDDLAQSMGAKKKANRGHVGEVTERLRREGVQENNLLRQVGEKITPNENLVHVGSAAIHFYVPKAAQQMHLDAGAIEIITQNACIELNELIVAHGLQILADDLKSAFGHKVGTPDRLTKTYEETLRSDV